MISMTLLGIVGLLVLFVLLALRMPVALSMLGVGFVGTIIANANKFIAIGMSSEQAWGRGWKIAFSNIAGETFEAASNYNLLVIPMFVLMGNLAGVSGLSSDLFNTAYRWLGHLRGGLASATIAACAGFAALSGSSLASAVTMGRVALPQMKKHKYECPDCEYTWTPEECCCESGCCEPGCCPAAGCCDVGCGAAPYVPAEMDAVPVEAQPATPTVAPPQPATEPVGGSSPGYYDATQKTGAKVALPVRFLRAAKSKLSKTR